MKPIIKLLVLIIFAIAISSCKTKEKEQSAELYYTEAFKKLKGKDYRMAAEKFEKIDDDFPFSKWAVKGQIMAIYSYYKAKEYEEVIRLSDDFTRLNSTHENFDYVLYMKGLVYYDQIPTILRAQDFSRQASSTFRELIARFPSSQYSTDAKERLHFVDEHLAGAFMANGRYKIRMKNYVGAIDDFQTVVNRYRFTDQVPEGYYRLAEIYYKIGLIAEAKKAKEILVESYPNSYFTQSAKRKFKFD